MERISRFSFLAFLIVFLEMSPVGSSAAEVTSTTSPQQLVQSTGSGPSFDCAAARLLMKESSALTRPWERRMEP